MPPGSKRNRRDQGFGIRVFRRFRDGPRFTYLDQLAEVHHADTIGDVRDYREIVGDEEVRQVELPLEPLQQVEHLGLNRHI